MATPWQTPGACVCRKEGCCMGRRPKAAGPPFSSPRLVGNPWENHGTTMENDDPIENHKIPEGNCIYPIKNPIENHRNPMENHHRNPMKPMVFLWFSHGIPPEKSLPGRDTTLRSCRSCDRSSTCALCRCWSLGRPQLGTGPLE